MGPRPEPNRAREDVIPGEGDDPRAGRDRPAEGFDREPHHELANPAADPDATEYPDPFERRPDPRDPAGVDTPAEPADPQDAEGDANPRDFSTSDPHPPRNFDRAKREGDAESS